MTPSEQDVERVAAIFNVHRWKSMGTASVECECGEILYGPDGMTQFPADKAFRNHLAHAALAAMPTPSPVTSEVTAEQVEAAKADLSIQALALAWMDHLGYTSEQVTEAEAWRAPSEGEEPEDYDGPPQAVSDLDWACEFAREIVDPAVDRLLRAAGVVVSPEGGEG